MRCLLYGGPLVEAYEFVAIVEKGFLLGGVKRFRSEPFESANDAVARAMALVDANSHCDPDCVVRKIEANRPISDSKLYAEMSPRDMLERWPQYKPFIRIED